jgi:F-type H+-transporting ATPase subunit a
MHALEQKLFYAFSFVPLPAGAVLPWLVTLVLVTGALICTRSLTIVPGTRQNVGEWIYESLESLVVMITGPEHARQLLPFLATLFVMVLSENLLGLVPGLKSPTSVFSNCVSLALTVFLLTHGMGFYYGGLRYLKHFWGEPWWLGPLMFPIHIIGELSRPLSLTLRLFGNIMGEDVVILVLTFCLFPLLVPLPMMMLAIFTSFLQALVFTILAGLYLSGALPSDHHP